MVDMIGEATPSGFVYQRKAGGAPFNVACTIAQLKGRVAFVGCVGDDLIGQYLIEFAKQRHFEHLDIRSDSARNTTLAFVELDETGERSFCFYRHNTADYHLPAISDELLKQAKIVHIGSLMLSTEEGREYALNLADRAHQNGALVSFDVNYRDDIFQNAQEAKAIFLQLVAKADLLKLSEEEVEILASAELDEALKTKWIFITLGKDGSKYIHKEDSGTAPSISVKVVDTTGAGDAFYGGVLHYLDALDTAEWNQENLVKV
ncbi:MAG: carbohydrate kinase, partial [Bacilli bacterium]|nr:carbohydrate kinase [Bacilli bacterium]